MFRLINIFKCEEEFRKRNVFLCFSTETKFYRRDVSLMSAFYALPTAYVGFLVYLLVEMKGLE